MMYSLAREWGVEHSIAEGKEMFFWDIVLTCISLMPNAHAVFEEAANAHWGIIGYRRAKITTYVANTIVQSAVGCQWLEKASSEPIATDLHVVPLACFGLGTLSYFFGCKEVACKAVAENEVS